MILDGLFKTGKMNEFASSVFAGSRYNESLFRTRFAAITP